MDELSTTLRGHAEWKNELDSVFEPQSVGVVGASADEFSRGNIFVKNLIASGYDRGRIYPINPRYETVLGLKCFKSIREVGKPIDFAAILLGYERVNDVVKECVEARVNAGIVVAAGFEKSEELESKTESLREMCEKGKLRLVGPNCMGIMNPTSNFVGYMLPVSKLATGNVALVVQTGGTSLSLMQQLSARNIGISHLVTIGNELVINSANYLTYLLEQPEVCVIGVMLEGVKDAPKLLNALDRALELGKIIVALKSGRTSEGARAALSHTGSIVGEYQVFAGAMKQKGVILVDSIGDFIEEICFFSKMHSKVTPISGLRTAMIGISGFAIGVATDILAEKRVPLIEVNPKMKKELEAALPPFANASNPLDTTGGIRESAAMLPKCVGIFSNDPSAGAVALLMGDAPAGVILSNLLQSKEQMKKPLVFVTVAAGRHEPSIVELLAEYPVVQGLEAGIEAVKNFLWYCAVQSRAGKAETVPIRSHQVDWRSNDMAYGFELLESYGIPVAPWKVVHSKAELPKISSELGFPLVLKPNSTVHKANLNLVKMNIEVPAELDIKYDVLLGHMKETGLGNVEVIAQRMIRGGTELMVGSKRDSIFGNAIIFGLGGTIVEILHNYSVRLPPLRKWDALEMIEDIRGFEFLKAKSQFNIDGLVECLLNFSNLVSENFEIDQIDVNPIIAKESETLAADVRIVLEKSSQG